MFSTELKICDSVNKIGISQIMCDSYKIFKKLEVSYLEYGLKEFFEQVNSDAIVTLLTSNNSKLLSNTVVFIKNNYEFDLSDWIDYVNLVRCTFQLSLFGESGIISFYNSSTYYEE